jgi:hypothetical protein
MAISIVDAHDFIRSIIKKNKAGFVSPKDIDRAINRGVADWMSAVIYKYHTTGKFEYDHLLVKRTVLVANTGNSGVLDVPTDYVEGLTIYHKDANSIQIEGTIYSWDEFLEIKNSSILAPDRAFPAATIYINSSGVPKIEFAPVPTSSDFEFTFVYMRKPTTAYYNAVVDSGGNISASSTGNVDIDVADRYYSDIITRALMYLGITLDNGTVAGTEAMMDANQKNDER